MLKPYLFLIEEAVYIFLFLAIPLFIFQYKFFGKFRMVKALVFYSFCLYLICTVFLVLFPLLKITDDFCDKNVYLENIQIIPFKFILDIWTKNNISWGNLNLISILKSQAFLQAFLNFLLLMPLGFYLNYYFRASFKIAAIISLATTTTFEVTQVTGIYGIYPCPHRLFDVDDLILNSSGAIVGYLIIPVFLFLLKLGKKQKKLPQIVTPLRRLVAFSIDWFAANSLLTLIFLLLKLKLTESVQILLDYFIYFIWFIVIPYFWDGQTLGKKLLVIHLTPISSKRIRFLQLSIRYGLLIFLPVTTEVIFNDLFVQHKNQLGAINEVSELIFFGLFALEFWLLFGLVIVRRDHRGIHDLLSKTQNAIEKTKLQSFSD